MPQFQYKEQQFQQDAVRSVVDVFRGVDFTPVQGRGEILLLSGEKHPGTRYLLDNFRTQLDANLDKIQARNRLTQDSNLGDDYLAIDTQMETGTGKTFTFINTIFELHKQYGLTHFVVIVPSIAIKEGIKKAFDTTAAYFDRQYRQRINVLEMGKASDKRGRKVLPAGVTGFIDARQLTVLIMTNHAFNRESNLINRDNKDLEVFHAGDTPMDAIAAKNPVLLIDEPQRVEGEKTAARIKNFNPLFVLRYSATFKNGNDGQFTGEIGGQIRNLVYALDSYDAFHQNLVKGISVTDYKTVTTDAASLGVKRIIRAGGALSAELDAVDSAGKAVTVKAKPGRITVDPKDHEGGLLFAKTKNRAYRGLHIDGINARDKTVTFSDASVLMEGEYRGRSGDNDAMIAEAMLRDTIDKHLQKESELFARGIKCISLFFIDRVKDYRDYDAADGRGTLQTLFEKCYADGVQRRIASGVSAAYREYLNRWQPSDAHGGYFSADNKRNQKIDAGEAGDEKKNEATREIQQEIASLILRDKERVLHPDNKLRFIFAHSALREGWDNPNVFQICKLRSGYSESNLVQEVGRGLRICVDRDLQRQDRDAIGDKFGAVNRLDVFTLGNGEFIGKLQSELNARRNAQKSGIAAISVDTLVDTYSILYDDAIQLFIMLRDAGALQNKYLVDRDAAAQVLADHGYDPQTLLGKVQQPPRVADGRAPRKSEAREYAADKSQYAKFKQLWKLLHKDVLYRVKYSADFVANAVAAINATAPLDPAHLQIRRAELGAEDEQFNTRNVRDTVQQKRLVSGYTVREFLAQLAGKTDLPRNTLIDILQRIDASKYAEIKANPVGAIEPVVNAIRAVIHRNIVDNIEYYGLPGMRDTFVELTATDATFSAKQYIELDDLRPDYAENNLWTDIAPYDSEDPEKKISQGALMETNVDITVFAKLPRRVNIPAPMHANGINPDFAIVVRRANGDEQLYFVAEAKPTADTDELRREEKWRVAFMRKYFDGIDAKNVKFGVVKNYGGMLTLLKQPSSER